jgi:glutamine amidotransferase
MCRALAYLGSPVLLNDLLFESDSSLMKQTYAPQMLKALNLAGLGMVAWVPESQNRLDSQNPEIPFIYRTIAVPFFDRNLKVLAQKLRPTCLLAHIRGVIYDPRAEVNIQNVHPFKYENFKLAMAHNGDLADIDNMKLYWLDHHYIKHEIARNIKGTTDSEWMYALLMSQMKDPTADLELDEILPALKKTLTIIKDVREKKKIHKPSYINLFICDGNDMLAARFTFDLGCYDEKEGIDPFDLGWADLSLWFTLGRDYRKQDDGEWKLVGGVEDADSVIVASEPLTKDITNWTEVPEYSALYVKSDEKGRKKVNIVELDI